MRKARLMNIVEIEKNKFGTIREECNTPSDDSSNAEEIKNMPK
jgi:hypothetical protein